MSDAPAPTFDPEAARLIVEAVEAALDGGEPVAVATVTHGHETALQPGLKLLVRPSGARAGTIDGGALDERIASIALEQMTTLPRITMQTLWVAADGAIANRRSQAAVGAATVMVELFEAPARLVIVGGGHVGLALATVGELCGFSVAVFDDREDFANRERLPMAEYVYAGDIDAGLDAFDLGASDYVVLVSRGHQVDEQALRHTVGRGAAYVGMIGSRRRTGTVLNHLLEEGVDRDTLESVHTPIGLDIGAETPEEIAISILAEIIMVRRGGSGEQMKRYRGRFGAS
jgi:xanthine dehydrogenase accessory factor